MEPRTKDFKQEASKALADATIQKNMQNLYDGFFKARERAADETPGWEAMQDKAREIKAHTIGHLDYYLDKASKNVEKSGGTVFFATKAEDATRYVLDLAISRGVKTIIKSKSMISEEMGLNEKLEEAGMEPVETDLGEYLIQLRDETPYHIIAPAIHLSKDQVSDLLHEKLGGPRYERAEDLTRLARDHLRTKFIEADMGITGANFLVADTGSLVLVTNEGNGRMCTSMPRIHVAIMGMEKIVPALEDMGIFLRLLIRSATGQRLSSYVTMVNGPRSDDELDGPEEFHLVIVDNGRSKILADPAMREALYCIRCGACLNACPVYRKVGGHSYGWVYSGPIGAVISPMLTNLSEAQDLPYASSLCGACRESCPVKIDLPRLLIHLRSNLAEGGPHSGKRSRFSSEFVMVKAWRLLVSRPWTLRLGNRLARLFQFPLAKDGKLKKLPPPISGWTRYRTFPMVTTQLFRDRWARGIQEKRSHE